MSLTFEWNPRKATTNLRKHKVSFAEATTAFNDPFGATVTDPDHSNEEERFILVGQSNRQRLLIIAFTERSGRIRIINARLLTEAERKQYEEQGD